MAALEGKVAVVTGAGRARGLGFAIASRLAADGARVVLADLSALHPELAQNAASLRERGVRALVVPCDVTAAADVAALFAETRAQFDRVDILVNNAGVIVTKLVVDTTEEEWERSVAVIGKGTFLCSKAAVEIMIDQGTGGKIVNISSISGKRGVPYFGAYTFAKFGVIGLTQTLAREVASYRINVNAVCPGTVETDMIDRIRADRAAYEQRGAIVWSEAIPLGRSAFPSEVAGVVAFLASEEANYITGQAINVDGGRVTH